MARKKPGTKTVEKPTVSRPLTQGDVDAGIEHAIVVSCAPGEPIQFLVRDIAPDQTLNILIDLLSEVRKMDAQRTHEALQQAFAAGVEAERQRVEIERQQQGEPRDMAPAADEEQVRGILSMTGR